MAGILNAFLQLLGIVDEPHPTKQLYTIDIQHVGQHFMVRFDDEHAAEAQVLAKKMITALAFAEGSGAEVRVEFEE